MVLRILKQHISNIMQRRSGRTPDVAGKKVCDIMVTDISFTVGYFIKNVTVFQS